MWIILAVLCLATGALARKQFIVGGEDVDIADFPWQGSYRTGDGSHICGCVFVGSQWVLTAAHCGGSSAYSMEFGGTDRGTGTVFGITAVMLHPGFSVGPNNFINDIAVVQAMTEISGTNISPATIVPNADNPGGTGWITGWGQTCSTCEWAITLQGAQIPIIADSQCADAYGASFQSDSMICTYDGGSWRFATCNGDSGGGLTVGSSLYGLASWASPNCNPFFPAVYNRVGAFKEWICAQTSDSAEGC